MAAQSCAISLDAPLARALTSTLRPRSRPKLVRRFGNAHAGDVDRQPSDQRYAILAGMTDGPVAISLFSGAGGLDLGVEAAGYRVTVAVGHHPDAALTMGKNFRHLASPGIRLGILNT